MTTPNLHVHLFVLSSFRFSLLLLPISLYSNFSSLYILTSPVFMTFLWFLNISEYTVVIYWYPFFDISRKCCHAVEVASFQFYGTLVFFLFVHDMSGRYYFFFTQLSPELFSHSLNFSLVRIFRIYLVNP